MSGSKTLLLLGGSRQQVAAIETAKACGYRTVLCDYLSDNPGQYVADVFYQESTTDREKILEIARTESVGGVIAYSSDPAAPTAAYVAEMLGLPTNPLRAVETLSVKTLFREHMQKAKLPCPQAVGIPADASIEDAADLVEDMRFPIVVKPTDSSGSKGVSVVRDEGTLGNALAAARVLSRNGMLIAEEYIERAFPHVIGGDVFVVDGEIRFWGLMSCLRDAACPLVPVGKKSPSGLSEVQFRNMKAVLQQLVDSLDICFGELNVEVIIGEGDVPFIVELGARAGGNMIPVQLTDASGIDLVRANVMCAMGCELGDIDWEPGEECYATYVLHSNVSGIFEGYKLSPEARSACYREVIYITPGTSVKRFDGANKALGILFFKFGDEEQMNEILRNIDNHVRVVVA